MSEATVPTVKVPFLGRCQTYISLCRLSGQFVLSDASQAELRSLVTGSASVGSILSSRVLCRELGQTKRVAVCSALPSYSLKYTTANFFV